MIKYQTFNRSCSYTGIANMLAVYSVNVEDRDIIKEAMIPYFFDCDIRDDSFIAGPMLQGKKWFDLYLNKIGFEFKENHYKTNEIIDFLDNTSENCLIPLKTNIGKHSVVFVGKTNNKYNFLNIKHKNTNEPDYHEYDRNDLLNLVEDDTPIGVIAKSYRKYKNDIVPIFRRSLDVLNKYKFRVLNEIENARLYDELLKAKYDIFEAIFLDVVSMMEIIGESDLSTSIKKIRDDYIKALKLKKNLTLSNYISIEKIKDVLERYIKLIEKRFLTIAVV